MSCTLCRSFKRGLMPNVDLRRTNLSFKDLDSSGKSCECCKIMFEGCSGLIQRLGLHEEDIVSCDLWLAYRPPDEDDFERDCANLIILRTRHGQSFTIEFFALSGKDGKPECLKSWDDFPSSLRTTGNTSSDAAFDLMQSWLGECLENHELCSHRAEHELPTRLVDVGLHDGVIKLVHSEGRKGEYIALSHCWGPLQIVTTTNRTLQDHMSEISREKLSNTFDQAIQLTRRLGIPYIWIDSLCIIQDDRNDWATEASKMASFYENALLTIAATRSSSGKGGLYASAPDFELTGITRDRISYRLIFRERIEHELMDARPIEPTATTRFPLMSRAWILQERLLSSRVLHLGPYELFFECNASAECECGEIYGYEVPMPMPKLMHSEALNNAENTFYISRAWHALVGLYAGLSLTVESDMLPAFGGLARQMAQSRKSRYLAGLWEDTLKDDLMWQSGPKGTRTLNWRAPSWSWASAGDPIYYRDAPLVWYDDEAQEDDIPIEHFFEINECSVTPATVDEFGELEAGVLKVTGRCAEATLRYGPSESSEMSMFKPRWPRDILYLIHFTHGSVFEITPDYSLQQNNGVGYVSSGTKVTCLLMSMTSESKEKGVERVLYSLVLKSAEEDKIAFERIGFFQLQEKLGDDVEAGLGLYPADNTALTIK